MCQIHHVITHLASWNLFRAAESLHGTGDWYEGTLLVVGRQETTQKQLVCATILTLNLVPWALAKVTLEVTASNFFITMLALHLKITGKEIKYYQ